MRHRRKVNKLSRPHEERKSLLIGLAKSLIKHRKVDTTLARAKEAQKEVERLITLARRGDAHAQRLAFQFLQDKEAVKILFTEIGPQYKDQEGGYTRVVKLGPRRGDGAELARLMLV
ncbi:TPA: 50S ribosomal protein L17 [Candidatus Bipolaricaulota bacterium]|nr:50S ribosomal protein L17 [Candidatus Bipolaricaulota bacterium]